MDGKRHVLIVENRSEWHLILDRITQAHPIEFHAVQTYREALRLLDQQPVDLAIVDLTLRATEHDYDKDGTHDGLQVLAEIVHRFPHMHLIVIGQNLSLATLRNTPGLPATLNLITRSQWDQAAFQEVLSEILLTFTASADAPFVLAAAMPPQPLVKATPASILDNPTMERALREIPIDADRVTFRIRNGTTHPLRSGLIPPGVGSRPGRPRILIAEDELDWQDKLAQLIEADGYFWRVAPTAEQAIERLKLETFHLILLDLMLGDRDVPLRESKGWQLLDYVVANCPKTKLIVISGSTSSADVARLFMGYPIKAFVDKRAFNEADLRTIVREQNQGPALRIATLGDFRVWRDGQLINDFGPDRAELVIEVLLSRRGESISVGELTEVIWPGANATEKYAELNMIVNAARVALEPDLPRPSDSKFILRSGSNYQFNMINIEVDAEQLRQYVSEGRQFERRGDTDAALRHYKAARELYHGDYLPTERLSRWTMQERSALQTLYTEALNRMADLHAEKGDLKVAIEVAQQAQQVDAYVESTYRRLMRYYACMGNKSAALAVYRRLVILFSEFFSEDPSPETTSLYLNIETDRPVACTEGSTPISN